MNIEKIIEVSKYLRIGRISQDAGYSKSLMAVKAKRYRKHKANLQRIDGDGHFTFYEAQEFSKIFNKIIKNLTEAMHE